MDMRHDSCKPVFVVAFNGRLEDGCDYATQTIRLLARTGHVYGLCLGEPISWRTILSFHVLPIIEKRFGALIFRPVFFIPGQRNYFIRISNYMVNAAALYVYIALTHPTAKKFFWFFEPFNIPELLRVFSGYITLYDCVDYFYDFSYKTRNDEQRILFCATYVFANSKTLQTHLMKFRKDTTLVPLGFSIDAFRQYEHTAHKRKQNHQFIVGYVGGIDARLDVSLLMKVVRVCPTMRFQLYGKIEPTIRFSNGMIHESFQRLFSLSNVTYAGEVPKSIVPAIIDTFDVGIIPYRMDSEFNTHCFPMKVMEYLYLKKPVLTTPITELFQYQDVLHIARTPKEWCRVLHDEIRSTHSPIELRKKRRIALAHTWKKKIAQIAKVIGLNEPKRN